MAALANIVLADAQGSPVNHTFAPVPMGNGVQGWEDSSATVYSGYNRITASIRRPKPNTSAATVGTRNIHVALKIELPTMTTVTDLNPDPVVRFKDYVNIDFSTPENGLLITRKNARKFLANLMANQQIIDLFEQLTMPTGV